MRACAHTDLYPPMPYRSLVAKGILIAYRTKGQTSTASTRVAQKLYGQDTTSRGYAIRRRGLLDDVPHVRLIRGVLVLREQDAQAVRKLLDELGCEVHERRVELTPDDEKALKR
jgi:hypothetical protein